MELSEDEYLAHYGILRRSGRYPWGSGETQHARNRSFLQIIEDLKKEGMSDEDIRKGFSTEENPISSTQWRAVKSIAKNQQRAAQISQAETLKYTKGMSNTAAAAQMGIPESTFRALLAPGAKDRADILINTAEMLKKEVADKKYIDVGSGVESHIQMSKERLNTAVAILQEEGYEVHHVNMPQISTSFDTRRKILAAPGTTWGEVQRNRDKIGQITAVSSDFGGTFTGPRWHDPISIHPDRVQVKYKEDGGDKADGVIYVRPGVPDISLGAAKYAQVRVKVGDKHYLKGMAMYKDDLPPGTDLVFHTNKTREEAPTKQKAMKDLTDSPDYPFKTVVRQQVANIGHPSEHVTSAMNIVYEEGQWGKWAKSLSSQFLSKQSPALAKEQLAMTYESRLREFNDIQALTNPAIKKKLLEAFAEGTDASSVHLSAAALASGQRWHAILPIESMKPGEIYAPNYETGERVVLIRYPHAGVFEIPELTVNNKHPEAKRLLGNAKDAVGIHHTVAEHLSGADFDGDTVIVIPNNPGSRKKVTVSPMLEQLKDFNPRIQYKKYDGMEVISPGRKQQEMGYISNLITDMTIKGASHEELAHAVKHSMVVIDSEKHELNYKQSALDNGIAQLKAKYQGGSRRGASTLISLSESEQRVPHRRPARQAEGGPIDLTTGEKRFVNTGITTVNRAGQVVPKMIKSTKGTETRNAHTLSSGTPIETVYADHSNRLKALANEARLAAVNTPPLQRSASAKKVYADEVKSLTSKILLAKKNAPLERQAIQLARASIQAKRDANPELEGDSLKKIKSEELTRARNALGVKKKLIEISDREWEAIQHGAISNSQLIQILNNTDLEKLREKATPRTKLLMSSLMTRRAKSMLDSGYTRSDVAKALGVSIDTLDRAVHGEE